MKRKIVCIQKTFTKCTAINKKLKLFCESDFVKDRDEIKALIVGERYIATLNKQKYDKEITCVAER